MSDSSTACWQPARRQSDPLAERRPLASWSAQRLDAFAFGRSFFRFFGFCDRSFFRLFSFFGRSFFRFFGLGSRSVFGCFRGIGCFLSFYGFCLCLSSL